MVERIGWDTSRPGRRKDIDMEARRYYVYRLSAADGGCLYVGRSCNVVARLKAHHKTTDWAERVVGVDAWGPFTWREACERERDAVYAMRPQHNRMYVLTHTYRTDVTA